MKLNRTAMIGMACGLAAVGVAATRLPQGMATGSPSHDATAPAGENRHVPGEIIIKLKGTLTVAQRDALLKKLDLTPVQRLELINADLVRLPPGESVEQALERLKKNPSVDYAEPNNVMRAQ